MDLSVSTYYNPVQIPLPFTYTRMNPPLFIASGVSVDIEAFLIQNSKEFYKLGCRTDVSHRTVMNCGVTLGEYSMLKSMDANLKRIKKSKPN